MTMTPIEYILQHNIVRELIDAYNVNSDYKDDLQQHIYLILLQYDQNKLQTIIDKNQIKFFIARIITNQWFSKTSSFFKTFKKYNLLKQSNNATDTEEPQILD